MCVSLHQRVVAVAGDHVAVRRGRLYINETEARPFPEIISQSSCGNARQDDAAFDHHSNSMASYTWRPTVVPEGHVMVLGDSRDVSFDSHIWGPLPVERVIGRARARWWPLHRAAWFRRDPAP